MDRFLHSSLGHPLLRYWCANSPSLKSSDFMYPIFVVNGINQEQRYPTGDPGEGGTITKESGSSNETVVEPSTEGAVKNGSGAKVPKEVGIPGLTKIPLDKLVEIVEPLVRKGLKSVLLFASVPDSHKDERASVADTSSNPVLHAINILGLNFPDLLVACDLCLCNFTDHGHCGIIKGAHLRASSAAAAAAAGPKKLIAPTSGTGYLEGGGSGLHFPLGTDFIDNSASLIRLVEIGMAYSRAGAHVLAPSDMMDGRIGALKKALVENGLQGRSAIMSYSAKFASAFYGPFRDMVGCKIKPGQVSACPSNVKDGGDVESQSEPVPVQQGRKKCLISNDRSQYQLPVGSSALAMRALGRDAREGADILMVKPATAYLDIVRMAKIHFPTYPIAVYQVSGEYAMLYYAAQSGCIDLESALVESILCMKRAGADMIISYFTPLLLDIIARASDCHLTTATASANGSPLANVLPYNDAYNYSSATQQHLRSPSEFSRDSGVTCSSEEPYESSPNLAGGIDGAGADDNLEAKRARCAHLNEMLFL